jgi:hypothetical protein
MDAIYEQDTYGGENPLLGRGLVDRKKSNTLKLKFVNSKALGK